MKRILLSILMVLVLATSSFAAIGAATVWEIRQDATANNVNGGGFDSGVAVPGTDYSQQAAAQDYGTDLACADGDVATPTVTSATHDFVAADEGNIIHITAGTGWTAGWYLITDTSANAAILDRACGTDGEKTGGTWYEGGALSLGSSTAGRTDDDVFEMLSPGNIVYVKYSSTTITWGTVPAVAKDGTALLPIEVIGYDTNRTTTNADVNRQSFSSATPVFGDYTKFANLIMTSSSGIALSLGTYSSMRNMKVSSTYNNSTYAAVSVNHYSEVLNCDIQSQYGTCLNVTHNGKVIGNYLKGITNGVYVSGTAPMIGFNVISGVSTGILLESDLNKGLILNNTLFGTEATSGTGINLVNGANFTIANNIIYGWATGVNASALDKTNTFYNNNLYNNDTNRTNVLQGAGDLAADPAFVDTSTDDFTPGVSMKANAMPGAFSTAVTGYLDIGAVQRVEPTGGSGGGAYAF